LIKAPSKDLPSRPQFGRGDSEAAYAARTDGSAPKAVSATP
jgi:hypothetical protein